MFQSFFLMDTPAATTTTAITTTTTATTTVTNATTATTATTTVTNATTATTNAATATANAANAAAIATTAATTVSILVLMDSQLQRYLQTFVSCLLQIAYAKDVHLRKHHIGLFDTLLDQLAVHSSTNPTISSHFGLSLYTNAH